MAGYDPKIFSAIDARANYVEFWRQMFPGQEITERTNNLVLCPFHEDSEGSLSVKDNGQFKCHACGKEGNAIIFLKEAKRMGGGEALDFMVKFAGVDKEKFRLKAKAKNPKKEDVLRAHTRLTKTPSLMEQLEQRKGITESVIRKFKVGFEGGRYWFPVYSPDMKSLLNIRRYKLDPAKKEPKTLPFSVGLEVGFFPAQNLDSDWILLCEGETDALRACVLGLPGVTVCGGAQTWRRQWNKLFAKKRVVICYDSDSAGLKGSTKIANNLLGVAAEVKVVGLPSHTKGYDLCDYFGDGNSKDDLLELIKATPPYRAPEKDVDDSPYAKVHLSQASRAEHYGKRVEIKAVVAGKDVSPYYIPIKMVFICNPGESKKCSDCPVAERGGEYEFEYDKEDIELVSLINTSTREQDAVIRRRLGIPAQCRDLECTVLTPGNLEQLRLIPEIDFTDEEVQHVTREGFCHVHGIETNRVFIFRGRSLPSPKTQHVIHLFHEAESSIDNVSQWKLTDDINDQLQIFRPDEHGVKGVHKKLREIYEEFEFITGIQRRHDLFYMTDLAYHSVLGITFQGRFYKGYVEVLVIGDTRQGKSTAVKGLLRHYRAGELIGGESLSLAGLKGGLAQMASRWILTWGKMPLNDRRLIVIDEASGLSTDDISELSSMRSEGIAEVTKIVTERTHCRVRQIWLSNPRNGRSLNNHTHGVKAILELIGRKEDISRFDAALTVATGEVDMTIVNRKLVAPSPMRYDSDACHNLVMWAWSRKRGDVIFPSDTRDAILELSSELSNHYSAQIPLVEPAEQRIKTARMSAALAARLFSTDDGTKLIVKVPHVEYVIRRLHEIYARESMGYLDYSESVKATEELKHVQYFEDQLHMEQVQLLLRNPFFNQQDFMETMGIEDRKEAKDMLRKWMLNNAVTRGRNSLYKLTPAMIAFLKFHRKKLGAKSSIPVTLDEEVDSDDIF